MLETSSRKRSYLELRLSELRNPGLSTKLTTSSMLLRYLLYVLMTVGALSNSLFVGEKVALLLCREQFTKMAITRAPIVRIAQPRTPHEANDELYAYIVSIECFHNC